MVQISLSLDKERFTDLTCEGASINVLGTTAAISITHMRNTSATYVIEANTTDFEMDGIQFRAATMGNLSFDFDFGDEVTTALTPLTEGASQLNEGATQLAYGSNSYQTGLSTLSAQMDAFTAQLESALEGLQDTDTVDVNVMAAAASEQYASGLSAYTGGVDALAVSSSSILQALTTMQAQASTIPAPNQMQLVYVNQLASGTEPRLATLANAFLTQSEAMTMFSTAIDDLTTAYAQFDASLQTLTGNSSQLTDGYALLGSMLTGVMEGISQLNTGITAIVTSYDDLNSGTVALAAAISDMNDGVQALPETVQEKISELSESLMPSSSGIVSFVAQDNNVYSVLFIMQTEGIHTPKTLSQEEPVVRTPETVIEKFLNLFGWYNP